MASTMPKGYGAGDLAYSGQNAYLRPVRQPVFDTEIIAPITAGDTLNFFCAPIRQKYSGVDGKKTDHDTNMTRSEYLEFPREFSILGFAAIIDPEAPLEDRNAILGNGATFKFFINSRQYLHVPLENICARAPEDVSVSKILAQYAVDHYSAGADAVADSEPIQAAIDALEKCAYKNNFHKLNIGRSALKIKHDEKFYAEVSWKNKFTISRQTRLVVEMIGLYWMPL